MFKDYSDTATSTEAERDRPVRLVSSNDVPDDAPITWPARPHPFPELMTAVEAAQYLRLDEFGTHTPQTAIRTLNFWRDKGQLKATKFARRVWYRRAELDRFLAVKTES